MCDAVSECVGVVDVDDVACGRGKNGSVRYADVVPFFLCLAYAFTQGTVSACATFYSEEKNTRKKLANECLR